MSPSLAYSCPYCGAELQLRGLAAFLLRPCAKCGVHVRARNTIGRFDLREQLAASGLGILVRARDRETDEECAIRLLHLPSGTQPEDLKGFLAVGRAVMALEHPHVARVVAVGVEDGMPFVAREWLAGESLAARLAQGGGMPEAEVLTLAVQAASALGAAHAQGLLHRDLRPANFILADAHTVKLTDFGQAILYDCASEVACIVWGTPCYTSPERLRFMPEDARSDIYALGATLCHALTGQPPYDGEVQGDVLFERLEHEVTQVEKLLPTVRPTTAAVLNRMLAADANDRPQSWSDTIELLTHALAAVPVPLAAPRPPLRPLMEPAPRAATVPVRSSATSGSWVTVVMLLMLCGVLGYAGWQWRHWPATSSAGSTPATTKRVIIVAQPTPIPLPPAAETPAPVIAAATPPVEKPSAPIPPPPPIPTSNPTAPAPVVVAPTMPATPAPATPMPAPPAPPSAPPPVAVKLPAPPPVLFDFNGWTTAKMSKPNAPPVVGDAQPMPDKAALRIAGNTDGVSGRNDTVVFHYRELEGDWTLIAHVASITGGVAGIMVREKIALSCWCLAATIGDDGSIIVRTREHADSAAILTAPLPSPKQGWLELVRHGPTLVVAHSTDGKVWRVLSTLAPPGLGAKVPVGFFASGATATGSATATLDHLALKPGK